MGGRTLDPNQYSEIPKYIKLDKPRLHKCWLLKNNAGIIPTILKNRER